MSGNTKSTVTPISTNNKVEETCSRSIDNTMPTHPKPPSPCAAAAAAAAATLNPPPPPVVFVEATEYDILCGKDKNLHNHLGNRLFRERIEAMKVLYQNAKNKPQRVKITKDIIKHLQTKLGSRFLKKAPGNIDRNRSSGHGSIVMQGVWVEIGFIAARDKVSHALRFANRHHRPLRSSTPTSSNGSCSHINNNSINRLLNSAESFHDIQKSESLDNSSRCSDISSSIELHSSSHSTTADHNLSPLSSPHDHSFGANNNNNKPLHDVWVDMPSYSVELGETKRLADDLFQRQQAILQRSMAMKKAMDDKKKNSNHLSSGRFKHDDDNDDTSMLQPLPLTMYDDTTADLLEYHDSVLEAIEHLTMESTAIIGPIDKNEEPAADNDMSSTFSSSYAAMVPTTVTTVDDACYWEAAKSRQMALSSSSLSFKKQQKCNEDSSVNDSSCHCVSLNKQLGNDIKYAGRLSSSSSSLSLEHNSTATAFMSSSTTPIAAATSAVPVSAAKAKAEVDCSLQFTTICHNDDDDQFSTEWKMEDKDDDHESSIVNILETFSFH